MDTMLQSQPGPMSEAIQLSRSAINFQLLLQFHLIHVCTVVHTVYMTIFVVAIHFLGNRFKRLLSHIWASIEWRQPSAESTRTRQEFELPTNVIICSWTNNITWLQTATFTSRSFRQRRGRAEMQSLPQAKIEDARQISSQRHNVRSSVERWSGRHRLRDISQKTRNPAEKHRLELPADYLVSIDNRML